MNVQVQCTMCVERGFHDDVLFTSSPVPSCSSGIKSAFGNRTKNVLAGEVVGKRSGLSSWVSDWFVTFDSRSFSTHSASVHTGGIQYKLIACSGYAT